MTRTRMVWTELNSVFIYFSLLVRSLFPCIFNHILVSLFLSFTMSTAPPMTQITMDFRMDRVRLFVDDKNVIVKVPNIG